MTQATIPFPWYLLIYADDETPLIVSADDFDLVVIFTDLEFARLYGQRTTAEWDILEVTEPENMIEFFEHLIDAEVTEDDRPITHACFDPIDPAGDLHSTAFSIQGLLSALRNASD